MVSLICGTQKKKKKKSQSHRKRVRLWLPRVEDRRYGEVYFKGYILSVIN